jgi:hypothetical protein
MNAVPSERDSHLAAFLRAARQEVPSDLARWHATLEALDAADAPDDEAYAVATVNFHGRHYRYRRRVWPPTHPPPAQAALYATTLVERLLTVAPTTGPDTAVITL